MPFLPEEAVERVVADVAEQLGETDDQPIGMLRRMVNLRGPDFVQAVVQEARTVEAQGGLMTRDGSRRRTLGGVFFALARHHITKTSRDDYLRIFQPWRYNASPTQQAPLTWADRLPLATELAEQPGEARARAVLVGRPIKVLEKGAYTILPIPAPHPKLPKNMPTPPPTETAVTVYVNRKQWGRARPALDAPNTHLVIEGYPCYDPELEGVALFATATKAQQQSAKRAAKQAPKSQDTTSESK
jgi:hypothetical protein